MASKDLSLDGALAWMDEHLRAIRLVTVWSTVIGGAILLSRSRPFRPLQHVSEIPLRFFQKHKRLTGRVVDFSVVPAATSHASHTVQHLAGAGNLSNPKLPNQQQLLVLHFQHMPMLRTVLWFSRQPGIDLRYRTRLQLSLIHI